MRAHAAVRHLLLCVALAPVAPPVHAQVIAGRILEAANGAPVAGAQLRLLAANGTERGAVVSDSSGWFQLRAPAPGRYSLTVQHIAYVAYTATALELAARQTLMVEIRLGRDAIPLEPLVVTARRAELSRLAGFRERAATNPFGQYVMRDEIDRRPAANVSDFFRGMSAVRVLPVKRNANPDGMTTYVIMMRGSGNEPAPAGADVSMAGMCSPSVYLDGTRVPQSASSPIDDLVQSGTLEGIEVYTSFTSVPADYRTFGDCGAALLWTRALDGGGRRGWWRHLIGIGAGVGLLALVLM